jgi:hypothetical protein
MVYENFLLHLWSPQYFTDKQDLSLRVVDWAWHSEAGFNLSILMVGVCKEGSGLILWDLVDRL